MAEIMNWDYMEEELKKDDLEFYEEYLLGLTDEQIERFCEENPEFLKEYAVYKERIPLLRDANFRNVLRRLKEEEYL